MGKASTTAVTAAEMKRKKKKGRPSKNPLPLEPTFSNSTNRRSTRRNPNNLNSPPQPELDDDEDERKEKKVKLVVRLPQSDDKSKVAERHQQQRNRRHSQDFDSASGSMSGSGSDPESEEGEGRAKKSKINGVDRGSVDGLLDQEKEVVKATETPLHGSPLESGPTTPLPDKKLLVFILDRLQKKDTYGVYSEPVDPNELPDYFDIIEKPMDFGTVRKKLDGRAYKNLEQLEADVFLICSNAMQYNAPDTVYYRQAQTIQDLAKRDFNNLKLEGDNGEPQPKVVRRGRPPSSKNQKRSLETSQVDRDHVHSELSSGTTLATGEDKATGSNSYNLRKGSALFRFRSTEPFVSSYLRNSENHSESSSDWNYEFPASILRADMKYAKKHFTVDENRRDTYRQYHLLPSSNNSRVFPNSIGNMKQLVPVGFQEPFAYARSLARYAANLGPLAWKIASKKIEAVLPPGVQYGPGWVGDIGVPSFSTEKHRSSNSSAGDCNNSSKLLAPTTSDLSSAVAHGPCEGVGKLRNQNEVAGQDDASSWRTQFPSQPNPMHQSYRNGFSGMFGVAMLGTQGASVPEHSKLPENRNSLPQEAEMWNLMKSSLQQRHNNTLSVPPDLNIRVPTGSPSSTLQIGSPKQPDLALQL